MFDVLNITAPIFLLIFLGYIGVRFRLLPKESLPGLSRFVLYYALPALIFSKLLSMNVKDVINPQYLLAYSVGGLVAMSVGIVGSRVIFKDGWEVAGIRGIGSALPNSVFIGFPILLQFFDSPPVQALTMVLLVENIVLLPVGLIFVETFVGKRGTTEASIWGKVLQRIFTNPIILAVFAGIVGMLVDFSLPVMVTRSFDMLAAGAAGIALVIIGGSLVGVTIRGSIGKMLLVAVTKLLVFPLTVLALLQLMPALPYDLKVAVIVFSAMPMFSIYPIIGSEYGESSSCASTLLVTTVLSFFTLSVLLGLLG